MASITIAERAELIAKFKTGERKEDMIALVGNLPSMRLVLAWPKFTILEKDGHTRNNTIREKRLIWVGIELDFEEIADALRIPHCMAEKHVFEAQLHLWIYPDGTVNRFVYELSKATIVRLAKGNRRGETDDNA